MNRKVSYLRFLVGFLVFLMAAPPWVFAQSSGAGTTFREEELDQMLAPIALYPDSLLGQILVAATFPAQVPEADRWVNENKNLQGDELNAELDRMDWDLSVKALVPFPQVLDMMSDKMDWTQRMGEAFLAQQEDVMDSVQRLRGKAHAQGNLNSTEQQRVVVRGESIEIEPANPRIVYVPAYNPAVIYGSWWYPSYPPYAYSPYYPGYMYDPYYSGAGFITAGLFGFAAGIAVGSVWNSGWGHWDWGRRNVNVTVNRHININRDDIRRGDIRTSNWRNVNNQRSFRSGRGTVGVSGNRSTSGNAAMRSGNRPNAASFQSGLKQREGRAQMGQAQNSGKDNQAKVRSGNTKMGRTGYSGKSNAQMSGSKSFGKSNANMSGSKSYGKSNAKMNSGKSFGKSNANMNSGRSFGKSGGNSLRNTGSSGRVGKANVGGGGGGHGGGGGAGGGAAHGGGGHGGGAGGGGRGHE